MFCNFPLLFLALWRQHLPSLGVIGKNIAGSGKLIYAITLEYPLFFVYLWQIIVYSYV